MGTPEWSIKPRQVYEAQKIKMLERTRVLMREVIRKGGQINVRMGTQSRSIAPIYDMIDETYMELGRSTRRDSRMDTG